MAFFLKAIGLSDDIPGFPFTPAPNDPGYTVYTTPQLCWTVRPGTQSDDERVRVSIFTCSVAAAAGGGGGGGSRELIKLLAQNAMRRAKSLMIPGFLKCHGAVEYRDTVYIATEPCVSLKDVLESAALRRRYYGDSAEEYAASVAYGLVTIGGAVSALQSNRLLHGNLHCGAVFVAATSGFWRLFGLELISSVDDVASGATGCLFESARRAGMLPGYRCPPELSGSGGGGGGGGGGGDTSAAVDAWGLACVVYETMGVTAEEAVNGRLNALAHSLSAAELRNACRLSLPKPLHQGCSALTAPNPRMRKSIAVVLDSCEFVKDCVFVQYTSALSELLLMDLSQQVRLAESLAGVVDRFPLRACLCFVLPRLGELVTAAAKVSGGGGPAGVSVGPVADPVLKVAERAAAGEDFDAHVAPVLVQLFRSSDVLLRYKLLVGAAVYGPKLSSATLNDVVWPLYAKGFGHTVASVREYSARGIVHLAPHLSEAVLSEQVPKALAQLQRDPDGALRANATVALHLVSEHITPATVRATVMLTYCRPMLRDAFEPSRVAALRSLHGALECLTAKQLAEAVVPAVAPLTVDPTSTESRAAALALVKASLSKLEGHHRQLAARDSATSAASSDPVAASAPSGTSSTCSPSPAALPTTQSPPAAKQWSQPSGSTPLPSAGGAAHHVDAATRSSPLSTASPLRPTTSAAVQVAAGATAVAGGGGGGWSDDDEDEDDWGGSDGDRSSAHGSPAAVKAGSASLKTSAAPPPRAPTAPFASSAKPAAATSALVHPLSSGGGGARASPSPSASHGFAASPLPLPRPVSTVSDIGSVSSATGSGSRLAGASDAASPPAASPSNGPMKLRKKGGLGAARLD
ncbi:hypothetical protein NESM_000060800 [Novymonas esmeraldas]|uniref:Protein kinase domain-containing protein n=1 Tax=Novymonas esmeraldas TaxID=1808958 RepID=A0AAW0F144_9TRYP